MLRPMVYLCSLFLISKGTIKRNIFNEVIIKLEQRESRLLTIYYSIA